MPSSYISSSDEANLTLGIGIEFVKEGGQPGEKDVEAVSGNDVANDQRPHGGMGEQQSPRHGRRRRLRV